MTIRPLGDRIAVKLERQPEQTESGLWLPDDRVDEDRFTAEVLAVGPGARCPKCGTARPLDLEPGQLVVLGPHSPVQEVTIDGDTITIVKAEDVIAVLVEASDPAVRRTPEVSCVLTGWSPEDEAEAVRQTVRHLQSRVYEPAS